MLNTSTHAQYCGPDFQHFHTTFKHYHGYISIAVCIFGIIANILNIIVLTRKNMTSSINTLLTGLALADMLVMIDYLPYAVNHYILIEHTSKLDYFTYSRMILILVCDHVLVVGHTVSIAFTLTLAVWRYIAVNHPLKASQWCNPYRTRLAIVFCYFLPLVVCVPIYISFSVQPREGATFYEVGLTQLALRDELLLARLMFWLISVVIKLVPCVVLCFLSLFLVRGLRRAGEMKSKLVMQRSLNEENEKRVMDKTTRMLLGVLVLFIVTEFPVGILALMTAVLGDEFYGTCYLYLREVRTILLLVNSGLNFLVYLTMSQRFRETFMGVLGLGVGKKRGSSVELVTEVTTSM
uniref:G-protein coupled receptors family 1 profile domain-containing protein n=1 Tax=Strigamia maritima TaxID=126957 RepID=T1IKP2_STRMM